MAHHLSTARALAALPISRSPVRWRLVLAASLALALPARTGEVTTQLKGKVNSVQESTPGTLAALAAKGVTLNAPVTVEFVIESTTPRGGPTGDPVYSVYVGAVRDIRIQIGSYQAFLDPTAGQLTLNHVIVGNDVPIQGSQFFGDSYLVSVSGGDTDKILEGSVPENYTVEMILAFGDGFGNAMPNDGLVQNFKKFTLGTAFVGGQHGHISMLLDLQAGPGPGPGPGPSRAAFAQKGQLLAASKFAQSVLRTQAQFAAAPPQVDPLGDKEAAKIDKAGDRFVQQFEKAVNKALKKGGTAPLPASAKDEAAEGLLEDFDALAAALRLGADFDDKQDRALRGKLLRAAAVQSGKDLAAHAKDALKPDAAKLAQRLEQSRAVLEKVVGKALSVADKQGVDYVGPSGPELADAVTDLVDEFVQLTQGGGD